MFILSFIFIALTASAETNLTGGMVDCAHLKVQEVNFSKCSYNDPSESLGDGKFMKYPDCWAKFSYGTETATLHLIDQRNEVECSSRTLNSYCLSPEERIVVNSPPCSGKTMSDRCVVRVKPKITHIPPSSYYDSRYQCACQTAGCGHHIHTFQEKFPRLSELEAAVKKAVPGCDDITIKNVTGDSVTNEVSYAISSLKCPIIKPGFVSSLSCPKGFHAARRLFVGSECTHKSVFAIACVPDLSMVGEAVDPCLAGNPIQLEHATN